jgi:signal transduction histidine kinase
VAELFAALRGMFRPLVTSTAVALVFDDASALPPLRTDELRLAQVLRNFISNAIKFTERGEIHVSAAPAPGAPGTVRFTVRDSGIGIAPEDQARIFERFERAVQDKRYQGLGLGLWITREIIDAHGGSIQVHGAPGEGSTFTVMLPRG